MHMGDYMRNAKRRSWAIIVGLGIVTVAFALMVPRIVIDNDIKNYFPKQHASYIREDAMSETYGSQMLMDIAVSTTAPSILNADAISAVSELTAALEALPGVEKVQSLTNIDFIAGVDGGLSAESLVPEGFVPDDAGLVALKARIVEWRAMYDRLIVSDDFKGTQIIVSVEKGYPSAKVSVLYAQVLDLVKKYDGRTLRFRIAGDPVIFELSRSYMIADLIRLVPLVTLVVLLCLFFSFKNLEGTLLPLLSVLFSTIWTIGLMALAGTRFTVVSSCLPIVMIAVGSAYGIHVVNHYYEELRGRTGALTPESHAELVVRSTKRVLLPVALAGVTTIAGFASNVTSPVVPLKDFSIFSAVGVLISLVMSVLLIPAFLIVKREPKKARAATGDSDRKLGSQKFFTVMHSFIRRHRALHVGAYAALFVVSAIGFSKLNIESSLINFFDEDGSFRRDVSYIDEHFSGTNALSLLVKGAEPGALADPAILSAMDDLTGYLKSNHPEIGKTISFPEFIKRMNRVMHVPSASIETASASGTGSGAAPDSFFGASEGEAPASFFSDASAGDSAPAASSSAVSADDRLGRTFTTEELLGLFSSAYARIEGGQVTVEAMLDSLERELNYKGAAYDEIPTEIAKYPVADESELKNLVSQYLLLYSGSLDQFANDPLQPSESRIQIQLTSHSTKITDAIIKDAKSFAAERFPAGYTLEASGIAEMEVALSDMIVSSQISSVLIAALAVFVILWIAFGSVWAGLIGALPLLVSILVNFSIMGFMGINLDMITSLITSIAIGIGIDYTIHFMSNYHHERLKTDDLDLVTLNTLKLSGKGIAVNAVSVGLGFLVLVLSNFVVLRYIGFLVAVIMLTSSVPAMTLLPLILNIFKPAFISRPLKSFSGASAPKQE